MTSSVELLEAVLAQLRVSRPTPQRMEWVLGACSTGKRPYWAERVIQLTEDPPATHEEWCTLLRQIMEQELRHRLQAAIGLCPLPSPENRTEVYRVMHRFDEEIRDLLVASLFMKSKEANALQIPEVSCGR